MLSRHPVGAKRLRILSVTILGMLSVAIAYFGFVFFEVWRHAHNDEAQAADAIVVLGAAQYRGRPSPVLKARLDHALHLYWRKLAPRLITTGGQGHGAEFTEGGVSRKYLSEHGVPAAYITAETEGQSTIHSATGIAAIMNQMELNSCIVVSDGYHIHRIKRILENSGLRVYGSPRTPGNDNIWIRSKHYAREAVGYILWRFGLHV